MSYHAGIGPRLGRVLGEPQVPHVRCDSCGITRSGETARGLPTRWIRNNQAPPGWRLVRVDWDDGTVFRRDYCPACKPTPGAKP